MSFASREGMTKKAFVHPLRDFLATHFDVHKVRQKNGYSKKYL